MKLNFAPFYLLSNCRRVCSPEFQRSPNWVIACELFAVGSTTAMKICREADIDPDGLTVTKLTAPKP